MTIVKLKGVQTREQAAALRGAKIFVRDVDVEEDDFADADAAEVAGETAEADYYVHELVGMRVLLPDDGLRVLGEVVGVVTRDELTELTMKGHELLEVMSLSAPGLFYRLWRPLSRIHSPASAPLPSWSGSEPHSPSQTQVRFGDSTVAYIDDEKALRVLIPFVPPIVPMVDVVGRILHITPPDVSSGFPPLRIIFLLYVVFDHALAMSCSIVGGNVTFLCRVCWILRRRLPLARWF